MFISALFTVAKTWKQPRCPLTVKWINESVVYLHNGILPSHKKNEIMPFAATWMKLEIIILNEGRERKTNIIYYDLYVEL